MIDVGRKGKVETALIGCEIRSEKKMRGGSKGRGARSERGNPRRSGVGCLPAGGLSVNPVRGGVLIRTGWDVYPQAG